MQSSKRVCGAKTRSGNPCQARPMPNGRCRMHGGKSPGAPTGNQNAFKHGKYSGWAKAMRALSNLKQWWLTSRRGHRFNEGCDSGTVHAIRLTALSAALPGCYDFTSQIECSSIGLTLNRQVQKNDFLPVLICGKWNRIFAGLLLCRISREYAQ